MNGNAPFELLVAGGGPAALAAARAYREAGGGGAVGLVTDERRMPYLRPALSKQLLRGEIDESSILLESERWPAEHGTALISGRAVSLDSQRRTVTLSGGRRLRYRHCLLATGAEPVRLPLPGGDDPAMRTLRSLEDLRELRMRLAPGTEVVVIGSGFIGCEIAASLRMLGHAVTLVADEPAPNVGRLGERAAGELRGWLDELGVGLILGTGVSAIERTGDRLTVTGEDERSGSGELVIMAVGVAPRAELAALAGMELESGAIAADARMRTAAAGVLAAGDVCLAEHAAAGRRVHIEHWGDALAQGEVAGRTAAGEDVSWSAVPGFWSTIGDRTLKYAGWGDGFEEARWEGDDDGRFAVWYGREGRVVGVLAHDADDAYERGRQAVAAGARWR